MSKNIIQHTQKSFKVPAVVYKYVAWQARKKKRRKGHWSFLSAVTRNRNAKPRNKDLELHLSVVSWWGEEGEVGEQEEKEMDVTPWWLGKWQARCSPLCIESWWPVAFWSSVWHRSARRAQSACLTPPTEDQTQHRKWKWVLAGAADLKHTITYVIGHTSGTILNTFS